MEEIENKILKPVLGNSVHLSETQNGNAFVTLERQMTLSHSYLLVLGGVTKLWTIKTSWFFVCVIVTIDLSVSFFKFDEGIHFSLILRSYCQ